MGLEAFAPRGDSPTLPTIAAALTAGGVAGMVVMVDGAFCAPGRPLPDVWRDVRVRTPAGTVTLLRREGGVAVVVFGNADEALQATQRAIVAALSL